MALSLVAGQGTNTPHHKEISTTVIFFQDSHYTANNSEVLVHERTIPTKQPLPTFADRGVSRTQRGGFPMAVISVF
jgi:hypothetical protein